MFSCLDGKPELNPETNSCQNVYLQRMMGKTLFVAPSDIAGQTAMALQWIFLVNPKKWGRAVPTFLFDCTIHKMIQFHMF